jgi:hypothetical protein
MSFRGIVQLTTILVLAAVATASAAAENKSAPLFLQQHGASAATNTSSAQLWTDGVAACFGDYVTEPQSLCYAPQVPLADIASTASALSVNLWPASPWNAMCGTCYEVRCDNRFNQGNIECRGGPYKVHIVDKMMEQQIYPPEDLVRTFDITTQLFEQMIFRLDGPPRDELCGGGGAIGIQYREVSC